MGIFGQIDIFISYCRIDTAVAKQLTQKLKEFG